MLRTPILRGGGVVSPISNLDVDLVGIRLVRIILPAFLSRVALGMQFLAETWATHSIRDETEDVSIVVFAGAVPVIFLSPWAGKLVDQYDRRILSYGCDATRALIWACGGLVLLFFEPSVALFVLLALLTAVLTAVYEPAFNALAVELVKPESFFRLNSLLAASHQVGLLSGAAAGGLLIELGVDWVMQGSAVCLGVAALCTLSLRKPAANAPTPSSDESET